MVDLDLLKNIIFFIAGIIVIYTDFRYFIIPDVVSIPLIVIGITFSFFTHEPGWQSALLGSGFGFLLFYLIAGSYQKCKKEMGLGGGDIKYVAAVGAFWGLLGLFFVVLVSNALSLIVFMIRVLVLKKKNNVFPYGLFLAISAFFYMFLGDKIFRL